MNASLWPAKRHRKERIRAAVQHTMGMSAVSLIVASCRWVCVRYGSDDNNSKRSKKLSLVPIYQSQANKASSQPASASNKALLDIFLIRTLHNAPYRPIYPHRPISNLLPPSLWAAAQPSTAAPSRHSPNPAGVLTKARSLESLARKAATWSTHGRAASWAGMRREARGPCRGTRGQWGRALDRVYLAPGGGGAGWGFIHRNDYTWEGRGKRAGLGRIGRIEWWIGGCLKMGGYVTPGRANSTGQCISHADQVQSITQKRIFNRQ